jgi:Mg-chelatase subunit ChlD
MRILFRDETGKQFTADVIDDRLTNIQLVGSTPPDSRGGGGGGSEPAEGEPKESGTGTGQGEEQPSEGKGTGSKTPPAPEDRVFIERLQAVLVNNRARKQLRNKQKGSLDLKALVRTQTNSQSVFKQNNRKDSQRNYSVVLLVDESGSMHGDKSELAGELATNVSKNLEKVGGVEVAVLGFSGNRIVEHKRFDNRGHNSTACIADLTSGGHCRICKQIQDAKSSDCENADLIAMEYSLDYLMRNKDHTSKPIFIMLSDGSPCDSRREITVVSSDLRRTHFESKFIRSDTRTRDVSTMHQLLARYPDINAFGLGMLMGGQQVPKHKVVNDIKETKGVLLDFLRTSIN